MISKAQQTLTATILTLMLALPCATATAEPPAASGADPSRSEKVPYVPRYQGPYSPTPSSFSPSREVWGFALVGTGALVGGLGLYALETSDELGCTDCAASTTGNASDAAAEDGIGGGTQLGVGMLVGGIFMAGLGVYFVAISGEPGPTVIVEREEPERRFLLSVERREGGGLVRSGFVF